MRYRRLVPGGPEVSELGFGASPLGGIYGIFAERDGIAAVHAALDAGINVLDVAPYYGLTAAETVLGKALRGVDHDGYVLATKVGRYGDDVFDFTAEGGVTRSLIDRGAHGLSVAALAIDSFGSDGLPVKVECGQIAAGGDPPVAARKIVREAVKATKESSQSAIRGSASRVRGRHGRSAG